MEESVEQKVAKIANKIRRARANQHLREKCYMLIRDVPERNYHGEISSIFHGIEDRVRYVRDPLMNDVFEDAEWTLNEAAGDCDAHTILIGSLLESIGYMVGIRIASYDGIRWSHVYLVTASEPNVVVSPENAIVLDATLPNSSVGKELQAAKIRTFVVD